MAKTSKSKLPIIILLTLLVVGLGLYGYSVTSKSTPLTINQISNATGEVSLTLSPSNVSGSLNSESTISLSATTGSVKLMVLTIELTYDPSKISTPTITQGSFLGNTLASPKVENGKITFTYAATPESGGSTGTGEVAIIKFKPIATGNSAITFTQGSIATAVKGTERIPGNSIKSAVDAIVTVASNKSSDSTTTSTTSQQTDTVAPTPARNDVAAITVTPKPTTKPTVRPTPVSQPDTQAQSQVQQADPNQTDDNPYLVDNSTTQDYPEINEDIPLGTVTDTTTPKKPGFFQKISIGWGIIFRSFLSLFE